MGSLLAGVSGSGALTGRSQAAGWGCGHPVTQLMLK